MNLFRHTLKTLLSFSRGERAGLLVLFLLLLSVLLYPVLKPNTPEPDYTALTAYMHRIDSLNALASQVESSPNAQQTTTSTQREYSNTPKKESALFVFDPNTADSSSFVRLGFSPKQTASIIRYRSRGAKFRTPDDFAKVYVVDEKMFARLKPYIDIPPEASTASITPNKEPATKMTVTVELNSADTSELKTVRGIGSYFAKAIVEQRARFGGFTNMEQLLEIRGMTEERLQSLQHQFTIDKNLVQKINLQTADEQTLKNHPYIGAYAARGILLFRKNNIRCTLDDLLVNNVLQKAQAEKLAGYVEE